MKHQLHNIKYLALALALGAGLGATRVKAQTTLEVGGSGTIGDTVLGTNNKVPTAGTWAAAGGEGFKNSDLISPPVAVTATGPVTLKFSHRYFFEKEWDGGAVFVIVNGAPATYLPITAFSANPYVGDTLANGAAAAWPGGEKVFFDKSAGYDTPVLIESVANLGTLNAGDTVSVQFRGRWDGGYSEPAPNWEMGKVNIADSGGTLLDVDFSVVGTSGFTVASDAGLAGPWLYLKGLSRFEINADSLTADRYKPATPGAVIDLNGANISVVLLGGTLAANETFTLFDLSGGTTLTGTPGTITLPPGYWNTSNLAVNGTIICVLPPMPSPTIPVTSGMKVWLAADAVNPADPTQVDGTGKVQQWNDLSGNNFHATNTTATQRPAYIANGMNGKPVLRFTEANTSKLFLGDLSDSFWASGLPTPVDTTPTAVNKGTLGVAIDGTYVNIPTRAVAGALVGDSDTATSLNGSTQYVNIPYSADLNPPQGQPWSAEIWAKSNVLGTLPPFSSGTPGNVTNRQGWVLYFINSDLSFRAYTNNAANATINAGNGLTIPGVITPNTWYHVVVTCDGTDFRIYLNGAEVGTTPTVGPNGTYSAGNTGTALGFRLGAGNYFNGTLDEAAFYTTTLSQPRIQAHYKNGINDPARSQSYDLEIAADAPVAHYKLNEPASTAPVAGASVFAVAAPNNDGRYNLFGNRANDDRWVANTWTESSPGSFRGARAGFGAAGYALWPQSGSHVFSMESSASRYRFVIDGNQNAGLSTAGAYDSGVGTSWTIGDSAANNDQRLNGDIAELILFDRVLTSQEAALVGGYLTQKYQLTTTYPPANLAVALNTPENALAYPSGVPVQATVTVAEVGTAPFAVQFWVDGALAGTATTAPYSLDLGVLANGTHSIYAKVIDSSTPTAISAFSAAHIFSVAPATGTTTALASSVNPSTYGEGTLTATVVANNASPLTGGTVQFLDGGNPLGSPVPVDIATGVASYNINTLGAGTHSLTATYSGHGVHITSTSSAISQVVEKATLTYTANNVFRPTQTANLDPLPYKITGFQNGETLATSGVVGDPLLTTPAVLSSPPGNYTITCALGDLSSDNYSFTLVNSILTVADVPDTFSVNFYVGPEWPYGGLGEVGNEAAKAALKIDPGMAAGFGDWLTSDWTNYLVPWAPTVANPTVTLTSNRGSTAKFTFIDARNGWTYSGAARTTLVGDGNGNMMDAHVNSTLEGTANTFKMEMTDIPFPVYDVIFYMGANSAQFGDGKGAIKFNNAPERDFTLKPGAFDGTFTEMVDATTPGNYIVFKGVTGSTFTTETYGKGPTGFNHIGPFGFQIRPAGSDYGTWAKGGFPGVDLSDPNADLDGDGWTNDEERLYGLDPTSGASVNPFTAAFNSTAGTFSFTRRDNALTGKFSDIETSTDLQTWTVDRGAVLVDNGPNANGIEIVNVTISPGLLAAPKLFVRINQRDASVPLSENFETGNGGFTVLTDSGSNWAWGDPDSAGAGGSVTQGNGGSLNCWGTNIGNPGYYITPTVTRLRSVEVDLTNVSAAQLTFAEALDLEAGDSAVVNIIESATNTVISPAIYTATDANSSLSIWEVANGGNPIPIPAAAIGKKVRIEWRLSGQAVDYFGWYIDDVMIKQVAP
jgi:hypothetical protein